MNVAYVLKGELVDQHTIKLTEPLNIKERRVTIVVETESAVITEKEVDLQRLVVRKVPAFSIMERDHAHER